MGKIEVELKQENALGTHSYHVYDVLAAIMEHDIGFLTILHSDGEETIQSIDEISNITTHGIELQHA